MTVHRQRFVSTGLLALTIGLAAPATALAQNGGLRAPDAGYIGFGIADIATQDLDDELRAHGYPTFGQSALAPGIGLYWNLASGLVFGGEWNGLAMSVDAPQGRDVSLGGGYATLGLGYPVTISPHARFYPRLALGGGGMGLWFPGDEADVGFDDVLEEPYRDVETKGDRVLSRGGMVLDLGGGLELTSGGSGRGPFLGVRFGYLATPLTTPWTLDGLPGDGLPLEGGPEASIAGPYVRVVVGWTRRR